MGDLGFKEEENADSSGNAVLSLSRTYRNRICALEKEWWERGSLYSRLEITDRIFEANRPRNDGKLANQNQFPILSAAI